MDAVLASKLVRPWPVHGEPVMFLLNLLWLVLYCSWSFPAHIALVALHAGRTNVNKCLEVGGEGEEEGEGEGERENNSKERSIELVKVLDPYTVRTFF